MIFKNEEALQEYLKHTDEILLQPAYFNAQREDVMLYIDDIEALLSGELIVIGVHDDEYSVVLSMNQGRRP